MYEICCRLDKIIFGFRSDLPPDLDEGDTNNTDIFTDNGFGNLLFFRSFDLSPNRVLG